MRAEVSHLCGSTFPHLGLRFRDDFWGWNADRISELSIGEVVLPEQVYVPPGDDGVVSDGGPDLRSELIGGGLAEAMLEEQVIPANDGILNEAVASLGDLLLLLVSVDELTRVADRDRASEPITEFNPVEQILDRHAQFNIVNVTQDEHGLDDTAERLESGVKAVLPGVGI